MSILLVAAISVLVFQNNQSSKLQSFEDSRNSDLMKRSITNDLRAQVETDGDIRKVRITDKETGELLANPELLTDINFAVIDRGPGIKQPVFRWKDDNTVEDLPFEAYLYGMELYKDNSSGPSRLRQIDYYLKVPAGSQEIAIYGQECTSVKLHNGTQDQCLPIIVDYRTELLYDWQKIESNTFLPVGKFEIEARTDVLPNERMEWIPTFRSIDGRVPQWASWTVGLNQDLFRVYLLNESASETVLVDQIVGSNASISGTMFLGSPSKIVATMNGSVFNPNSAVNQKIDFPGDTGAFGDPNFTIMFDYNTSAFLDGNLFRMRGERAIDASTNPTSFDIRWEIDGVPVQVPQGTLSTEHWYRLFFLYNSTGNHIIIDGNQTFRGAASGNPATTVELQNSFCGSEFNAVEAMCDNFYIWNRTLTLQEMQDLVNNGNSLIYTTTFADSSSISIDLESPVNNTRQIRNSLFFNGSITAVAGTIGNSTLDIWFLNGTLFSSTLNDTIVNPNVTNYNITNIPEATFIWNIRAELQNDTGTLIANGVNNLTFEIDSSPPNLVITAPSGIVEYHASGNNLSVTWTLTDLDTDTCLIEYDGSNNSVVCNDLNSSINVTSSSINSLKFYVNDTLNNRFSNTSEWRYDIFENSREFNQSGLYETDLQSIIVNATYNDSVYTSIGADLAYLSVNRTVTDSGIAPDFIGTATFDTPLGNQSNFFNWTFTLTNSTLSKSILSDTSEQGVGLINLTGFCEASPPNDIQYINFSFKNETVGLEDITASIPSSTWTYSLASSSGTLNKSLEFVSLGENSTYAFCFSPSSRSIEYSVNLQYTNADSQQRILQVTAGILTSATNFVTLFLLPTSEGIFTRYRTEDQVGNTIIGALAQVSRLISGTPTDIVSDFTDAAGLVTFFLNPDLNYDYIFSKTGFETNSFSLKPSSPDTYTIVMPSTTVGNVTGTEITLNLTYSILPSNSTLDNQTTYDFGVNIATDRTVDLVTFNLTNQSGQQVAFVSSSSSGFTSVSFNTINNTRLVGRFVFTSGNETFSGSQVWIIGDIYIGDYSIYKQFSLFEEYEFSNFIRAIILLLIMSVIMVYLSRTEILPSDESKVLVVMLFVWAFSIVGWLDTGFANPGNALSEVGSKFGIAILTSFAAFYFVGRRLFIRRP